MGVDILAGCPQLRHYLPDFLALSRANRSFFMKEDHRLDCLVLGRLLHPGHQIFQRNRLGRAEGKSLLRGFLRNRSRQAKHGNRWGGGIGFLLVIRRPGGRPAKNRHKDRTPDRQIQTSHYSSSLGMWYSPPTAVLLFASCPRAFWAPSNFASAKYKQPIGWTCPQNRLK